MSGWVAVVYFMLGFLGGIFPAAVAFAWWWFRAQRFTDTVFALTDGTLIPLAVIKHRRGTPPITAADISAGQVQS